MNGFMDGQRNIPLDSLEGLAFEEEVSNRTLSLSRSLEASRFAILE